MEDSFHPTGHVLGSCLVAVTQGGVRAVVSGDYSRVANPACQVVGISVNTQHLGEEEAVAYLADVEKRMGLPAVDPFRHGAGRLVDALDAV